MNLGMADAVGLGFLSTTFGDAAAVDAAFWRDCHTGHAVHHLDASTYRRWTEGDDVFVKELCRQKHVLVVHGSGFGQKPGSRHFRIVFLPDEPTLTKAYESISEFIRARYP